MELKQFIHLKVGIKGIRLLYHKLNETNSNQQDFEKHPNTGKQGRIQHTSYLCSTLQREQID